MFVGEEIGPWKRQGHPMASLQGGPHVFNFFAFIVYINQTMFISPPKMDLPWSSRSFYSLKFLVLYFTRPFDAVQLALVIAYL